MLIKLKQAHTHNGMGLQPGHQMEADERLISQLTRLGVSYEEVQRTAPSRVVEASPTDGEALVLKDYGFDTSKKEVRQAVDRVPVVSQPQASRQEAAKKEGSGFFRRGKDRK